MFDESIIYALTGHCIGDVLGSPYEFRGNPKGSEYFDPVIQRTIKMNTRYQGTKHGALGQPTDDTEMSLALLQSIYVNNGYNRERVIEAYMEWANTGSGMLGRNTRKLFKGIKTVKTYEKRWQKEFGSFSNVTQSNGSLMRCIPLCEHSSNFLYTDCILTNPNLVNLWISDVYYRLYQAQTFTLDNLLQLLTLEYVEILQIVVQH